MVLERGRRDQHLDLAFKPFDWGAIRLDLENYATDDDDTLLATVGIEFELDRLFD